MRKKRSENDKMMGMINVSKKLKNNVRVPKFRKSEGLKILIVSSK